MPLIESAYRATWPYRLGDVQTIFPTLFRRLSLPPYHREILPTPDGDELMLDWWCALEQPTQAPQASPRPLAIIAHGMEGSSDSWYLRGMSHWLFTRGWDILAWNMRGCGGAPNRKVFFYHSGKTDDLRCVVNHARISHPRYALIGFSLGGNVVLKHLGEMGNPSDSGFIAAATLSVPVDLSGCAARLAEARNYVYQKRFLRMFHAKIRAKMQTMPGALSDADFASIRNLRDFDNRYTAPDFGYPDAEAYWRANSSLGYIPAIAKPTLLLTSQDDPFLSATCYPRELARQHPCFTLEISEHGGHCGFMGPRLNGPYYGEMRVAEFLEKNL